MEDRDRTLVILLSMHRCGSSLATSILHRMGMSLGPFELMDAAPSNRHGHFETMPFYNLNRQVQQLAFGFADDIPESPEVLSKFIATRGEWPAGAHVPDELFDQGRSLIRTLIESAEISGFKDPRTVLTWPFWQRVLAGFPGLRVVPVNLLRSPHEIAMSLVTRRYGWVGYWTSLDVVAVHLRRQQAILQAWGQPARGVCFGSPSFMEALIEVARQCGLPWDADAAAELFDESCVHHVPAVVPHEAQQLFDSLHERPGASRTPRENCPQFVNDARFVEALRLDQWHAVFKRVIAAEEQAESERMRADDLARRLQESEARLHATCLDLIEAQRQIILNQQSRSEIQHRLSDALSREIQVLHHNDTLRTLVARYEAHPLLGRYVRGRRTLQAIVHSIRREPTTGATPNGRSEPAEAPAPGHERE